MGWEYAAGAAMDLTNTALGFYTSSKAYRRAKEMYQHRYQWAVDDMRKAGLNPILAGTNGASVSGANAPSIAPSGRLGENFNKVAANKLAEAQVNSAIADAEVKKANVALVNEQVKNTAQQTKTNVAQMNMFNDIGALNAANARQASLQADWQENNPGLYSFQRLMESISSAGGFAQAAGLLGLGAFGAYRQYKKDSAKPAPAWQKPHVGPGIRK